MATKVEETVDKILRMSGNVSRMDVLQRLLDAEASKVAKGRVIVNYLVCGGCEGSIRIDLKDIKIERKEKGLSIVVDGIYGELRFEIELNNV